MFPMTLIVQKFGGTSVADTDSLRIVAERIIECKKNGHDVVHRTHNDPTTSYTAYKTETFCV